MRLIDGDKLIDIITNSADLGGVWGQVLRAVKDAFIRLIRTMPNVNPEPQWIPCSERLPNTNGIYIVTRSISDGFEYQNITDACYFDGSNTWHDDTRINHERKYLADVVAWMQMPEPWKGE